MKVNFVNPYNFIPLAETKAKGTVEKGNNVGVIEYTLTTKSPVFIPNTSSDSAFKQTNEYAEATASEVRKNGKHISRDFFSYQELTKDNRYEDNPMEPVIPGSEIRGMVRNIYETLTDSCMGVLNEELFPSRRSFEIFEAGLIKREKRKKEEKTVFTLCNAENCVYKPYNEEGGIMDWDKITYKEGEKVLFDKEQAQKNLDAVRKNLKKKNKKRLPNKPIVNKLGGQTEGYIIKGNTENKGPSKKYAHIFCLKEADALNPKSNDTDYFERTLKEEDFNRLYEVINKYQNQTTSSGKEYEEYKERLEDFKNGDNKQEVTYFPVYYSIVKDEMIDKDEQPLYLSPASITREVFNHTIGDLAGQFAPCGGRTEHKKEKENEKDKITKLCPACALFGMVGAESETAVSSSIRFSDATISESEKKNDTKQYYEDIVTLPELSSPKLQNVEFYLENSNNAVFWTYDYYITEKREERVQQAVLRGRKFYWHHPEVKLKSVKATNRNSTVRPLTTNITFEGKLYFDGISDEQLKKIIWIMNGGSESENSVGNDDEGKIMYKIGMGKPLGLGSVKLEITNIKKRKVSIESGELKYMEKIDEGQKNIPSYEDAGFSKDKRVKDSFLLISQFHRKLENIHYPGSNTGEEGFRWYSDNHKTYKSREKIYTSGMGQRRTQTKLVQSLPLLNNKELAKQEMESELYFVEGEILKYNEEKKFGFIKCELLDKEVFFHKSIIEEIAEERLKPKVKVIFDYEIQKDGRYKACSLKLKDE